MRSPALTARGTGLGRRSPGPLLLPSSPLEFPRTLLLGSSVNKGVNLGSEVYEPRSSRTAGMPPRPLARSTARRTASATASDAQAPTIEGFASPRPEDRARLEHCA